MPQEWIIPTVLAGLAIFLAIVWIPELRRNRKRK